MLSEDAIIIILHVRKANNNDITQHDTHENNNQRFGFLRKHKSQTNTKPKKKNRERSHSSSNEIENVTDCLLSC